MNANIDIRCDLLVSNYDCPDADISRAVGINASETVKKGSVRRSDPSGVHPPLLHPYNIWTLSSNLSATTHPEEHIKALLERIRPNADRIAKLAEKYPVELSIYGSSYEHLGIHLEKETVRELGIMGIEVDFDVYSFSPSYLETPEQITSLVSRLRKLKSLATNATRLHQESQAIAQALATFESCSETITASLISDLFWDELSEKELIERLVKIRQEFTHLFEAVSKSQFLSQT